MTSSQRPETVETASSLHSAAIHLLRRVRRVDEESGLSAARLSALSVLVFGGSRTLGELAAAEQVSAPTMSRLVSGLERDGLAVRSPHPTDGRSVVVEATVIGRHALELGRERRVTELAGLLASLSTEELDLLDRAVGLVEQISRFPPSASDTYAAATAERRWSGLTDSSTGSGGTSG